MKVRKRSEREGKWGEGKGESERRGKEGVKERDGEREEGK